jgi:hypothetical protein
MADYGTVVGYFSSQVKAEAAINALKQAGFQQNQIGVAARSPQTGASSSSTMNQTGKRAADKASQSAGGAWEAIKGFFSSKQNASIIVMDLNEIAESIDVVLSWTSQSASRSSSSLATKRAAERLAISGHTLRTYLSAISLTALGSTSLNSATL